MTASKLEEVLQAPGMDDRVRVEEEEVVAGCDLGSTVHAHAEANVLPEREHVGRRELRAPHPGGPSVRGIVEHAPLKAHPATRLVDGSKAVARGLPAAIG